MDHNKEFDGIRQAENPMPEWWKLFFGLTFIFAVGYAIYFHYFSSWGMYDSFQNEVAAYEAMFPKAKEVVSTDGSNPLRENSVAIEEGKKVFMSNACAACHGVNAQGVVGPSLVDAEWIHGNTDAEIYQVIMEGITVEKAKLGKGPMPAHKSLGSEKVYQIMAWLAKTNPSLKKTK
jgi:cytochrome c oxidase cbb3-type subunit III